MIFWRLFLSFFKVGLLGFGGGLAIVRLIYDSIQPFVTMTSEEFANIVAISQITPGPLAVNTATYVGYVTAGIAGAASATFGVILPAFIIVSIVVRLIQQFKSSKYVQGALAAIRPATMGLIGAAVVTLLVPTVAGRGRLGTGLAGYIGTDAAQSLARLLTACPVDPAAILMVAATVLLMTKYKKSPFVVLIIMGCIGAVLGVQ